MITPSLGDHAGNRLCQQLSELGDGHGAQVFPFARTHRDGLRFNFPISNNQEIGNLEQSMLADFKADLLVSQVGLGTESAFPRIRTTSAAKSACLSVIFITTAWVGASQAGKAPA